MSLILYADVLFAINFIMDYLALYASSAVLRLKKNRLRLALGAFVGAAYCLLKLYVTLAEPFTALAVSLVMCGVSLWNGKLFTYIKAVILFYAASMLFGGVMTFLYESAYRYRHAQILKNGLTPGMFFAAVGILFILILVGGKIISHSVFAKNVNVRIRIGDKCENFRMLCDSGNLLCDPYNGLPVMVLDAKSLDKLLGKDGFHRHFDTLGGLAASRKFRYIPIHTPSGDGALPAFLPDGVFVRGSRRNEPERPIDAMIAVDSREAGYGENDGIIPLSAVCI